jgi:prepilin-type N-terminal cleavage/methylation domain-containing protein
MEDKSYMIKASKGFTLAELLIALALLGIIAAFTIPKVLNASTTQERAAKIRETVSTLEQAYYGQKMKNLIATGAGNGLFQNLNTVVNSAQSATGAVPAQTLPATHPCVVAATAQAGGLDLKLGYMVFQNGVVVTGLSSNTAAVAGAGGAFDSLQWDDASHDMTRNYAICIDYNGSAAPNTPGQDVFVGNFNQYGCFGPNAATVGCTAGGLPTAETIKDFNWGAVGVQSVLDDAGAIYGGATGIGDEAGPGGGLPTAIVGAILTGN